MTSQTEESSAVEAITEKPKLRTKPRVAPHSVHVAAKSAKSAKKGTPRKKSTKRAKVARTVRDGSKAAKVMDLLKRPDGATMKELTVSPASTRARLSTYLRSARHATVGTRNQTKPRG